MIKTLLLALGAIAGAAGACQSATNAALASRVGLALALVINTSVVLLLAGAFWIATSAGRPAASLAGTPWFYFLGGLFGFTVIVSITFVFPRLGAAYATALMVLGQGAMALAIDHHGLWGMPVAAASASRLCGVLLLVAGVALLRR